MERRLFPENQSADKRPSYYGDIVANENDPLISKVIELKDLIDGPIVNGGDPSLGSAEAPITIVEFSDFECGFCRKQEKILKRIMDEYDGKIRLIWKDYPVDIPSAASYKAAVAARCAQKQGEFWNYHNLLFEKNNNLNQQIFLEIARELDLNLKKFEKCATSGETENLVNDNIAEANALGVNGVPFIFVNKQKIMGEIDLDGLRDIINIELNK